MLASAAPPGFFECLQPALRETGQQLHVEIFGSMALFKRPLLFASASTVLGMEKSFMLFPCHQQVQFIYVQSWQNPQICCTESPVLKETENNMKCTWNSNLFHSCWSICGSSNWKMESLVLPEVFVMQTAVWDVSHCLGISKCRIWCRAWSYKDKERKRKSHNAVNLQFPNCRFVSSDKKSSIAAFYKESLVQ